MVQRNTPKNADPLCLASSILPELSREWDLHGIEDIKGQLHRAIQQIENRDDHHITPDREIVVDASGGRAAESVSILPLVAQKIPILDNCFKGRKVIDCGAGQNAKAAEAVEKLGGTAYIGLENCFAFELYMKLQLSPGRIPRAVIYRNILEVLSSSETLPASFLVTGIDLFQDDEGTLIGIGEELDRLLEENQRCLIYNSDIRLPSKEPIFEFDDSLVLY